MSRRSRSLSRLGDHAILVSGVFIMLGPVVLLLWRGFAGLNAGQIAEVFVTLWHDGPRTDAPGAGLMMWNSLVLAVGLSLAVCVISFLAAFALVFLRVPGREFWFGVILLTLFFPIETRILPSFAIVNELGLLNTYGGMILPLGATGLGVLIFRQAFRQIPPQVLDAARLDGAGPVRVLLDIVLPLSRAFMAGLFAICFVLGWNQYVWPIMVTTTSPDHTTLVQGMAYAGVGQRSGMALALLALLPPALVLVILMRSLMRGIGEGTH